MSENVSTAPVKGGQAERHHIEPAREEGLGLRARWAEALRAPGFRLEALLTALAAVVGLKFFAQFLAWVELRPGAELADPLLALYAPRDVAPATFVVIYGGILFALVVLARHPRRLARAVQAYLLLVAMRALLMWVTPFEAPAYLIPLRDPIVNNVVPGPPLQRDLFFSGHTSILVLIAFCMPTPRTRNLLFGAAVICAALLLVQHAHYTVDVLVAPLAAWAAYSLVFAFRPPEPVRRSARMTRL